jgi:hypothetical protein
MDCPREDETLLERRNRLVSNNDEVNETRESGFATNESKITTAVAVSRRSCLPVRSANSLRVTDRQSLPKRGQPEGGIEKNTDGSYDVYFGPTAPAGKEKNWIQTVPGKRFLSDPAPLFSPFAVVRQDLATRRHRNR